MWSTATGMTVRLMRYAIRVAAWLGSLFLTGLTLFLFTQTSQTFPRAFRSWKEIGFEPDRTGDITHSTPRFLCMSRCGRYFCTVDFFRASARIETDFTIRHWPGGEPLCTLPKSYHPNSILVSKDEQWIALRNGDRILRFISGPRSRTFGGSTWQIYRKDGAKWSIAEQARTCDFSPNGQSMMIATEHTVQVKSKEGRIIKEMEFDPSHVVASVFFDANENPKAVIFEGNVATTPIGGMRILETDEAMDQAIDHHNETECWDITTEQRDWVIEGLRAKIIPSDPSRIVWMASVRNDPGSMRFYSLVDARMLGSHQIWPEVRVMPAELNCLSHNGEFFVFYHRRPGVLHYFEGSGAIATWVNAKNRWLEQMAPALAESVNLCLLDTQTGVISKIGKDQEEFKISWGREALNANFHENEPLLTTFDDDGAYEWDLPPRMRWFTPWAWAALAAWLALVWFLLPWSRSIKQRALKVLGRDI